MWAHCMNTMTNSINFVNLQLSHPFAQLIQRVQHLLCQHSQYELQQQWFSKSKRSWVVVLVNCIFCHCPSPLRVSCGHFVHCPLIDVTFFIDKLYVSQSNELSISSEGIDEVCVVAGLAISSSQWRIVYRGLKTICVLFLKGTASTLQAQQSIFTNMMLEGDPSAKNGKPNNYQAKDRLTTCAKRAWDDDLEDTTLVENMVKKNCSRFPIVNILTTLICSK